MRLGQADLLYGTPEEANRTFRKVAAVTADMMIACGGRMAAATAITSGQRWVANIK